MKNLSQRGRKGKGPLVKNMKATLGTLLKGKLCTFGTKFARQKSCSSVILCIKFRGGLIHFSRLVSSPMQGWNLVMDCMARLLSQKYLAMLILTIEKPRPKAKKTKTILTIVNGRSFPLAFWIESLLFSIDPKDVLLSVITQPPPPPPPTETIKIFKDTHLFFFLIYISLFLFLFRGNFWEVEEEEEEEQMQKGINIITQSWWRAGLRMEDN